MRQSTERTSQNRIMRRSGRVGAVTLHLGRFIHPFRVPREQICGEVTCRKLQEGEYVLLFGRTHVFVFSREQCACSGCDVPETFEWETATL